MLDVACRELTSRLRGPRAVSASIQRGEDLTQSSSIDMILAKLPIRCALLAIYGLLGYRFMSDCAIART